MIQILATQLSTEVIAGSRALTVDISELQIDGFPDQFQLVTSNDIKVMFEKVEVDRFEGDIHMVTYKPMSPAFGSTRVIIFND